MVATRLLACVMLAHGTAVGTGLTWRDMHEVTSDVDTAHLSSVSLHHASRPSERSRAQLPCDLRLKMASFVHAPRRHRDWGSYPSGRMPGTMGRDPKPKLCSYGRALGGGYAAVCIVLPPKGSA